VTKHLTKAEHPEITRGYNYDHKAWVTYLNEGWESECMAGYALATFATSRSPTIQTQALYGFAAAIFDFCDWDADQFFEAYDVTPLQIAYVLMIAVPENKWMFTEFFTHLQYENGSGKEKHVIDIGFGLGGDSRFLLNMGYRVIAVEANPHAVHMARPMFERELHDGSLILIETAISEVPGDIRLYGSKRLEMSRTFINEMHEDPSEVFTLRATTCQAVFEVFGTPEYLKIDIEIDSVRCLESLANSTTVKPPKYISIELESRDYKGHFISLLSQLGYTDYKIARQYIYSPARCEQNFTVGCGSGPFGDDAVDYKTGTQWRTKESIVEDTAWEKEFETGFDWFDLHAGGRREAEKDDNI